MNPPAKSYSTQGGFEVSSPAGQDMVLIRQGGMVIFEIVLGGDGVKLITNGNLEIVAGGSISITAGASLNASAGSALNVISGGRTQLRSGGRLNLEAPTGTNIASGDLNVSVARQMAINGGDMISMKTGQASVQTKKDGAIVIDGKDITIKGSGTVELKASKDIIIKGKKILEN
jgi:type VI secretion system secreted protein VgrG